MDYIPGIIHPKYDYILIANGMKKKTRSKFEEIPLEESLEVV